MNIPVNHCSNEQLGECQQCRCQVCYITYLVTNHIKVIIPEGPHNVLVFSVQIKSLQIRLVQAG